MSFDGFFTHKMVEELARELEGGRISRIHQPYDHEVLLTVRSQRKNRKLLLSVHPTYARIQLTEEMITNPDSASNFSMFLRKNMEGAVIRRISQQQNDRIVIFHLSKMDEIGDMRPLKLVLELMGRHSNLFLIDEATNLIMDCLKHVPVYQNTYRPIRPGAEYQLPPHQDKLDPFTANQAAIARHEQEGDGSGWKAKDLQRVFQGIGRDTAWELEYLYNEQGSLYEALQLYVQKLRTGPPILVTTADDKQFFLPCPYASLPGKEQEFSSLSMLLDHYYFEKANRDRIRQVAADLLRIVRNERQKNELKITKLHQEYEDTERADEYRIKGEVLTAYLHTVPKGEACITLPNFYDEESPLPIDLDPSLTASQNAQRYFAKYQKLTKAVHHIEEQVQLAQEENAYLDSVETQIMLSDPQDLEEIREELRAAGYLRANRSDKRQQKKQSKPHHFRSSEGVDILVGKNNTQNDQLTLKIAHKNHIWLHAKNIPGSHVIIQDSNPSDTTLEEAAGIAAYFSKFQNSANVPVDHVAVRNVRKPSGAKPGFVIYEGQKTLYVTPSRELVERLRV